jgi:dTDP-4-dehydrorhamnose 3,5-epimerase
MNSGINGVEIKELKSWPDDRGFFREIVRVTDPFFGQGAFGQWSHSKMVKDVVKAWHYHHIQTDWWYLAVGAARMVLWDMRESSPSKGKVFEQVIGDSATLGTAQLCVKIPPGVAHGLRVLSDEAHLFYITSHIYNPNDEGRMPFNDPRSPFNFGPGAIIAPNDMRTFVPTAKAP